ncbi:MAG: FAD-dependent oxidoreductase [Deltaproteobacteria bacterium]|nr:FAD-dependent oxidoreductase [Deltaproteobacteria bacterium]
MSSVLEIDAARFEAEVLAHDGPVAVDFYSTECPPCEALSPKYDAVADVYGRDVKLVKIFRQGSRALADKLDVRSSPTVVFFERGREVGRRLTGGIKRSELVAEIDALLPPARVSALHAEVRPVATACDVLILGAGPAGVTAGIYAAQAKLRVIMVDIGLGGGNLSITHQVSNFPGFPKPQPGYMLAHYLLEHAKEAGVEARFAAELTRVDLRRHEVELDGVETIRAKKIVVATGSSPRELGVDGERTYKGKGISYCATCDAKYYEGKHVVVIGGGNSAIEESLFITKFAAKVTIVHQFAQLQANKHAQEQAFANEKIGFLFEHEPRAFVAERGAAVDAVVVEDLRSHERKTIECDGAFVFVGMRPNLDPFAGAFELDPWGYVQTDAEMRTSIPGVYAAGDVISKRHRQMTTAVSDGTIAAIALARELASS